MLCSTTRVSKMFASHKHAVRAGTPEIGADIGGLACSMGAQLLKGAMLVAQLRKELGCDTLHYHSLLLDGGARHAN